MGPVRQLDGLDGDRGPGAGMQPLQRRDTFPGNQRRIAAQDHDGRGLGRHRRHGHLDRVPGAQLRLLDDEAHPIVFQGLLDRLGLVAHHHDDVVNPSLPEGIQEVSDHGPAQDLMQHLGLTRLHPGPLARGQDDGGDVVF